MGFPRQEYWNGLPFPSPGDLADPGIEPMSPAFTIEPPGKTYTMMGSGSVAKWYSTLATPWTVACQAPLSMGLSRQEYWSGLPFPSPGDLADPGIEPLSPPLAGIFFITKLPGKPRNRRTKD